MVGGTEPVQSAASGRRGETIGAELLALIRPRLATLGLIMVALSYLIAGPPQGQAGWIRAGSLLLGSLLSLSGASALNQVLEREPDARMRRTAGRPLPAGRIDLAAATAYGIGLSLAGGLLLYWGNNPLTAILALLGEAIYLLIYTPMKSRTTLATVVGAVPGAVPVLMGWAAARNELDLAAWTLFCILFLWQLPHFLAIAWMYRSDYERAGFKMLASADANGDMLARQTLVYGLALIPVSILPSMIGLSGSTYFVGALLLGLYYLLPSLRLARARTGENARALLRASVIYLPLLFALMLLDRFLLSA
jgi:protoheme IX farnesyltransferase